LRPSIELGQFWPPLGIVSFDPLGVPFLNTLILLSSGVTVTFSHHYFLQGNYYGGLIGLVFTFVLGFYFTSIQVFEYLESYFTFSDSCYGSVFFIGTGFHGLHVIIGSIFLFICFLRFFSCNFGLTQIVGFDLSVWYWHFVDVV
jgi:heme/copper-type cytochrome/quinol oxidase subunit 3